MENLLRVDPVDDLAKCQEMIRGARWWEMVSFAEHWPLTTDEAAELLAVAGHFAVDAADLVDLVERQLGPRPAIGEVGEMEWNAEDVIRFIALLSERRQWRAEPSAHRLKKHPCEILLEVAREIGEVEAIAGGPVHPMPSWGRQDVRGLLGLLAECADRGERLKLLAILRAVLEIEHGVTV